MVGKDVTTSFGDPPPRFIWNSHSSLLLEGCKVDNLHRRSDSEGVVAVAADKMVTVNTPNIEFERRSPKITMVRPFCAAAPAGDALIHTEILLRAAPSLSTTSTVEQVAQALVALKKPRGRHPDRLVAPLEGGVQAAQDA